MPQENLITPDTVRRVCWEPPFEPTLEAVSEALAGHGARALADRAGGAAADATR